MSKLTTGELLYIDRKRRGEAKSKAAKRWKVRLGKYADMEADRATALVNLSGIENATAAELAMYRATEPNRKEVEPVKIKAAKVPTYTGILREAKLPKAAKAKPVKDKEAKSKTKKDKKPRVIKVPKSAFKLKGFKRPPADQDIIPEARKIGKRHTMCDLDTSGLKTLTTGEALVLHRRRLDESQTQAAARLGVGRKLYALWEIEAKTFPGSAPDIDKVASHEIAFIRRRRAGMSRADMTADGLNRTWVTAMERGDMDCSPLLNRLDQLGL